MRKETGLSALITNNQIAMYFGHSVPENPRHKEIEDRAIEWGCPIDFAILEDFDWTFTRTLKIHENNEIMNLLFTIVANRKVQSPMSEVKYRGNTSLVPTLLLQDDFLTDAETKERIMISDEVLNKLGWEIESFFGFQYLDFKRLAPNEHWLIEK